MNYLPKAKMATVVAAAQVDAKRRGVTLVEALMVIGVLAVLLGLAMLVAVLVNAANKSNQFLTEIATITDTANQISAGTADLSNLNESALANSGLLPNRWVSGSTLLSPFGSTITVTGGAAGAGTNGLTTYLITVPGVPKSACVKISTTDFGNGLVSRTPAGDSTNGGPLSATSAASTCATGGNDMTFEFTRS